MAGKTAKAARSVYSDAGPADRRRDWRRVARSTSAWADGLWPLFASQRLALALILLIGGASFVGAVLAQAPPSALADPGSYLQWIARVRPKYGTATDVLSALGLFHVFSTWWFRLLLALLATNILVCTLHRGGQKVKAALGRPRVVLPDTFFERARARSAIAVEGLPAERAEDVTRRALRASGYRVTTETQGGAVHAYADKNRFSPLGTIVHHVSIVLLLVGFIVSGWWGYRDEGFVVPEGTVRAIGGTGLAVGLDAFYDEYYPEGPPKDYRSEVTLYDGGVAVRQATVRVNTPLVYQGVRLHQSFFGPAAVLEVRDLSGALVASETVPLAWRAQDRPVGSFLVPNRGLEVYVVGPSSSFIDNAIRPGEVRLEVYRLGTTSPFAMGNVLQGADQRLDDLVYSFVRERHFSGFSVVDDPGRPVLWAASIALVLGLVWTIYFPHRQLWGVSRVEADGHLVLRLGAAPGKGGEFARELRRITERARRAAEKAGGQARVLSEETV